MFHFSILFRLPEILETLGVNKLGSNAAIITLYKKEHLKDIKLKQLFTIETEYLNLKKIDRNVLDLSVSELEEKDLLSDLTILINEIGSEFPKFIRYKGSYGSVKFSKEFKDKTVYFNELNKPIGESNVSCVGPIAAHFMSNMKVEHDIRFYHLLNAVGNVTYFSTDECGNLIIGDNKLIKVNDENYIFTCQGENINFHIYDEINYKLTDKLGRSVMVEFNNFLTGRVTGIYG